MSYIVNGKTYTSYPLLDDIVYNSKMILNGIVVKNEYVAHLYETEETLYNQEILFKCTDGTMTFSAMPYTAEMLVAFGYISKSLLVPGTYLFESSIAKDTTDLSKSYKQYVTIDENTKEVNFHPEGALYWYGYFINCTTYRSNMSTLQTAEELSRAWQDSYISIGTNSISTAVSVRALKE